MNRSPRFTFSFRSILIAAAFAACCSSARGDVMVPRDFVGIHASHFSWDNLDDVASWSDEWQLLDLPGGGSHYYWPTPFRAPIGVGAYSDKFVGAYGAFAYTTAYHRSADLRSMVVVNEFFRTASTDPQLHVHLNLHGLLVSEFHSLAAAWLDVGANQWAEPQFFGDPAYMDWTYGSIPYTLRSGGDSLPHEERSVNERISFPVNYNADLGGYLFSLGLGSRVDTNVNYVDSMGGAYFDSTIRIVDVTLPDGSPVPGGVTFDSGFTIPAVPEPSTAALFLLGAGLILVRVKTVSVQCMK